MIRQIEFAIFLLLICLIYQFEFTDALMVEDSVHRIMNPIQSQYPRQTIHIQSNNQSDSTSSSRFLPEGNKDTEGKFYYESYDSSKAIGKCKKARRNHPSLCDKRIYQIYCPETCFVPTLMPSLPPSDAPTPCQDKKNTFDTDVGFGKCKRARRDSSFCDSIHFQ